MAKTWKNKGKGNYKVLLQGKTRDEIGSLAQADRIASRLARGAAIGDRIVVRQSNPAKRSIIGYQEPNRKAYVVSRALRGSGKRATQVWSSSRQDRIPSRDRTAMMTAVTEAKRLLT